MSHEEQTDLRIRRTHHFLQEAMIELITEKGFEAITVGDIAERAMINRATFYRHYQDKYDKVPIYYVFGENDWQTPYVLAQEYFTRINAPYKKFYSIPNAGHMTMVDQPAQFLNILREIKTTQSNEKETFC
jgi:pimeloyl-ACP methyl ester carboxylesterase